MPKRIYSDEFRLQVVEDYLSGQNGGSRSLSKKYGIHNVTIDRWVKLYKEHGKEGLINCTRTYDGDFKIYVVEYIRDYKISLNEAAAKFCVANVSTISKWERIYYEEGPEALLEERRGRNNMGKKRGRKPKKNVNENEDLLQEVQRLRMENEYLKKLNALVQEREKSKQKKESK